MLTIWVSWIQIYFCPQEKPQEGDRGCSDHIPTFNIGQDEVLDIFMEFKYPEIQKVHHGGDHQPIFIPGVSKSKAIFEKEVSN